MREKRYIVFSANGKDVIGGMAADGYGRLYADLPKKAQQAIDDGSFEYTTETTVTSKFIPVEMTYYIREER